MKKPMRYLSQLLICFIVAVLGTTVAFAQEAPQQEMPEILQSDEVSDQELDKFVSAINFVESIQQQSQPRMLKAIENEGLDTQEYIEEAQAQQQSQDTGLANTKKEKIDKVQISLKKLHMEAYISH